MNLKKKKSIEPKKHKKKTPQIKKIKIHIINNEIKTILVAICIKLYLKKQISDKHSKRKFTDLCYSR